MSMDTIIKIVLPILGSVIAIVGVVLAVLRYRHGRRDSQLSSEPELEVFRELDDAHVTEVILSNEGRGPATIEKFDLLVDEECAYPCTGEGYIDALNHVGITDLRFTAWITESGKVVGAGKRVSLLKFEPEDVGSRAKAIREALNRVKFRFVYRTPHGKTKVKAR